MQHGMPPWYGHVHSRSFLPQRLVCDRSHLPQAKARIHLASCLFGCVKGGILACDVNKQLLSAMQQTLHCCARTPLNSHHQGKVMRVGARSNASLEEREVTQLKTPDLSSILKRPYKFRLHNLKVHFLKYEPPKRCHI